MSLSSWRRQAVLCSVCRARRPPQTPSFDARETLPEPQQWNPAATGMGRIDGPAKVTGAKLYASDFRASDLPGWPSKTSHALLICAADATHVFAGSRSVAIEWRAHPVENRHRRRSGMPPASGSRNSIADDLLCPVGKTPLYLGQPLAMLIFEQFDVFDQARLALCDAADRAIRQGDRPSGGRSLRFASFRPGCRPDLRGAGCVFADASRLGEAARLSQRRHPGLGAARCARTGGCAGFVLRRTNPRRTCRGPSGPVGVEPRIRDAIHRPGVSRAGERSRLVRQPHAGA